MFSAVTHAASRDFTIRTRVGDDTNPPTVPTGVLATPIATSQINVSWATSTDDFEVAGYLVYRDQMQIATTTNTMYADVGLISSTTYAYYVTAFDTFNNFSASSSIVSTTTFAVFVPPTTTSSSGIQTGSVSRLEILRLEIIPFQDSVLIRYETKGQVRSVIKWGRGISYELGSLAERSFSTIHETRIVGLSPGTTYALSIEGENQVGVFGALMESTFTTLPPVDVFPPGNVMNLEAHRDGDDVILSWTNPQDPDFAKVRVLRSDHFYPSDVADGWVTYEGLGQTIRDTGVVHDTHQQFYTVFTYDVLGNVSSGAIVRVTFDAESEGEIIDITKNEISLELSDVHIYQEGILLPLNAGRIFIDGTKALTIIIPYDRVPEHLKTILVTLAHPGDESKTFEFLLRINTEKTGYQALLAPLGIKGMFPLSVAVFDFKTAQVGYTHGVLISEIVPLTSPQHTQNSGFISRILRTMTDDSTSYLLLFVMLLILLTLFARRLLISKAQ
jgi:hypothetical protein